MAPILSVQNVSKTYGSGPYAVRAVDGVTLEVEKGEMVAIVGPSGSGKSTLLNILGLILRPDEGAVLAEGKAPGKGSSADVLRNRLFGYITQDFALLDSETVCHNIRLPLLYNKTIPRSCHKSRISAAAQELGIQDKLRRKACRLSGGERQRVAIARAIVCDQPILLADEPTGSLDAGNKELVMDILTGLCRQAGKTIILVTHDMSIARQCHRILEMRNGRVREI